MSLTDFSIIFFTVPYLALLVVTWGTTAKQTSRSLATPSNYLIATQSWTQQRLERRPELRMRQTTWTWSVNTHMSPPGVLTQSRTSDTISGKQSRVDNAQKDGPLAFDLWPLRRARTRGGPAALELAVESRRKRQRRWSYVCESALCFWFGHI